MKRHFFLTLFTSCLLFGKAEAREIHAFVGCDTASTVKESCKIDRGRMQKAIEAIAKACNMQLHLTVPGGKKLTPGAITRWLKRTHPAHDDVMLFYFAGHGNHKGSKKNLWPAMYLAHKKSFFHLKDVIKKLKKKKQQLAIILCDCCNSAVDSTMGLQSLRPPAFPVNFYEIQGIQTLFTRTKGMIIASGSVPGSKAWSTNQGGLFTHAFLYALQHEVLSPNPRWQHLFSETINLCQGLQTPQAKLSIEHINH